MPHTCYRCEMPIERADDGTWFVSLLGTSADGLSFCPPDPDRNPEGSHVPRIRVADWLIRAHTDEEQS